MEDAAAELLRTAGRGATTSCSIGGGVASHAIIIAAVQTSEATIVGSEIAVESRGKAPTVCDCEGYNDETDRKLTDSAA
jgi:hypothetical protein